MKILTAVCTAVLILCFGCRDVQQSADVTYGNMVTRESAQLDAEITALENLRNNEVQDAIDILEISVCTVLMFLPDWYEEAEEQGVDREEFKEIINTTYRYFEEHEICGQEQNIPSYRNAIKSLKKLHKKLN